MIGKLARLTKKQTNRDYFSSIPIGTYFIITDTHNHMPAYDLTGFFIGVMPNILRNGDLHFTGYIEKNSWELIGSIEEHIHILDKL